MSHPQDFFVELEGAVDGPMSGIEVRELALKGKVTPQTRVGLAQTGESKLRWFPAKRLTGLFDAAGKALPHPPLTQAYMKGTTSEQSRSVDSAQKSRSNQVFVGGPDTVERAAALETAPVSEHQAYRWHYSFEGQALGPVSYDQLLAEFRTQKLSSQTLVWREGFEDWTVAAEVSGLIPDGSAH
ncbi:MAG: DUF4339 domain-containing protein [Planctomycetota bacterium]|nr:DUF4339 domain-containing protein [Planctomycetota bacterium]